MSSHLPGINTNSVYNYQNNATVSQMSIIRHDDLQSAITNATRQVEPYLIAIRRDLYVHPELGFHKIRTTDVRRYQGSRPSTTRRPIHLIAHFPSAQGGASLTGWA